MAIQRPNPIDKEVQWDKTKTIMSRTTADGTIDYVNQVFVDVCAYSQEELLGAPHSIIRHPDMPKIIFKVLWQHIEKGLNFHAVIKNLAKTGEYYWVITDFDIIRDSSGKIVNYMARRNSVPDEFVKTYVIPLYKKLLQIESISGMDESERYLQQFFEENDFENYTDYITQGLKEFKS